MLALGGQRSTESSAFGVLPATFALLTAQLDEISITHARLPVGRLGWHSPSSRYEVTAFLAYVVYMHGLSAVSSVVSTRCARN